MAKKLFVSVMKTLRDAALFIQIYQMKSKLGEFGSAIWHHENNLQACLILGQFVGAQFPTKLEEYANELNTQKDNFEYAMIMQIAVDVDKTGMWLTCSVVFPLLNDR